MSPKPHILRRWITFMLALSLLASMALPIQAETGASSAAAPLPTCLSFTQFQEGVSLKSPLTNGDVQFYAETLVAGNIDGAGWPELTWTGQMRLFIPVSTTVKIGIVQYGEPVTVVAYDAADNEVSRSLSRSVEGAPQSVELTIPGGIRKLLLIPGKGRYGVNSLCYITPTNMARGEADLTLAVNGPARVVQGDSIEVAVTVANQGNAVGTGSQTGGQNGYRVELGLSKDEYIPVRDGQASAEFKEDMMLKRLAPTYDVAPGGSVDYKATVQIPGDTPPGVYCLSGTVDPYGVVTEANELNNAVCDKIVVLAKGESTSDTSGMRWIDFREQKAGAREEQQTIGYAKLYAPGGSKVVDLNADAYNELLFVGGKLEVTLPQSYQVTARLVHFGSPVTMQALYMGKVIATKQTGNTDGEVDLLTISAEAIDGVVFTIPKGSQGALSQLGFQAPDLSDDACDPRVEAIAAGLRHSIAILKDGTVWAWGFNSNGQLGNNSQNNSFEPVQVQGLRGILAVAAGREHSLALRNDGTVWAWGSNSAKQIGDKSSFDRWTPVQVPDLSNVIAVAAGYRFSMALKADGTVWAWGENRSGQLGDGTNDTRNYPVQVKGLTDIASIAAGANHALAVRKDGTLFAWGDNPNGELGNGTSGTGSNTPIQIRSITEVQQVAGGLDHTLALKRDGTVWAWGKNDYGQLGDGTKEQRTSPRLVAGMPSALSIATGEAVSYALRQDGTVWGWGYNPSSQLADGTTNDRSIPAQIQGLASVISLSSGQGSHVLALNSEGRLLSWGSNSAGQTGAIFSDLVTETPVQVTLKLGLLYCPIAQQPPAEEETPAEPVNPADAWKCTADAFVDVPSSHPACGAIKMLVTAKVVDGYLDGTFKPQAPITRAAMAKLLVAALRLKPNPSEGVIFTDTNKHWAVTQGWLQMAVKHNIVGGYPDKTFRPDLEVNRAAAIKMAAGALNIPRADGKPLPELRAPYTPPTAHLKDVKPDDWFYDPVVASLRSDMIGPAAPFPIFTGSQLEPSTNLTRGEAAILIANLLFFRTR